MHASGEVPRRGRLSQHLAVARITPSLPPTMSFLLLLPRSPSATLDVYAPWNALSSYDYGTLAFGDSGLAGPPRTRRAAGTRTGGLTGEPGSALTRPRVPAGHWRGLRAMTGRMRRSQEPTLRRRQHPCNDASTMACSVAAGKVGRPLARPSGPQRRYEETVR
ncbi:hypothetical protein OH76DRAFT_461533 [Lentinus brumalis]|uniref:Uncharacterized protein n=1 Tax=Lentinus brumalis TaxID=2498619 RepID=A0A371CIG2_9APHY|nr:hypothetical protein OH76DRAFT_461533 [Polyporus brumalis]